MVGSSNVWLTNWKWSFIKSFHLDVFRKKCRSRKTFKFCLSLRKPYKDFSIKELMFTWIHSVSLSKKLFARLQDQNRRISPSVAEGKTESGWVEGWRPFLFMQIRGVAAGAAVSGKLVRLALFGLGRRPPPSRSTYQVVFLALKIIYQVVTFFSSSWVIIACLSSKLPITRLVLSDVIQLTWW